MTVSSHKEREQEKKKEMGKVQNKQKPINMISVVPTY